MQKNAGSPLKFPDIICCPPPPPLTSAPPSQRITLRSDSKWVTSDRSHWSAGWERSPPDKREHVSVLGQALTCLTPSFAMRPQKSRLFAQRGLWVPGIFFFYFLTCSIKSWCCWIARSASLVGIFLWSGSSREKNLWTFNKRQPDSKMSARYE